MNLLIASSRKSHNPQSLDFRNQNPTYGTLARVDEGEREYQKAHTLMMNTIGKVT